MIIVDAHEDLAWNILSFGRDYALSVDEIRRSEAGSQFSGLNGDALLGWPEYQRGQVAVVFATLFASPERRRVGSWDTLWYATPDQANRVYRSQVDSYQRFVETHSQKFRLIHSTIDLHEVLQAWEKSGPVLDSAPDHQEADQDSGSPSLEGRPPVGLVLLMEGAEGVRAPGELEEWWQLGVRIIGPAWAGTRFCGGTREPGPLTPEGYALLEAMAEVGFILDLSHMDEQAVLQSLDSYPGTIIASHSNANALLKGVETNRHLSDRAIQGVIERGGMIGVVPVNPFLVPGWKDGDPRQDVTLNHIIAHIDYICQMAGDASHVGFGTDYDGGFGLQSVPADINSLADLQKLYQPLVEKGYSEKDIAAIFGNNWIERLSSVLPEES